MPADRTDLLALVEKIENEIEDDHFRLKNYVRALREELEQPDVEAEQREKLISELNEAYDKLTSPTNRIGLFVRMHEDAALIIVGSSEYVVNVDPKLDSATLQLGDSVLLNSENHIIGKFETMALGNVVKVSEILEDGRLRIGNGQPNQSGTIILRGSSIADQTIAKGDEVRLDSSGKVAVEHFVTNENQDYFLEKVEPVEWSQVGGQEEAIRLIQETIQYPLLHPELFQKFGKKTVKGVLLYGPPGCGKTLIGKATAYNLTREYSKKMGREVKEYFMAISGPKILNMWVGETERMVREIFATAREKAKEGNLVFIFMDEAESILRTRSNGRYFSMSNTVVPQFCAELDGIESLDNVVLMLTSNRPDYIDPAILRPGRIDRRVRIRRPDQTAAREIFNIYLQGNVPLDPELIERYEGSRECAQKHLVDQVLVTLFSSAASNEFVSISKRNGKTEKLSRGEFLSGAIIASIVDRAKDSAIRRAIDTQSQEHGISEADLLEAADREFKESEIFPKSDSLSDWLQLLDVDSEDVVDVRATFREKSTQFLKKSII